MASIHKSPASKYWVIMYRDAHGKQRKRSSKIEHTPPAPDAKARAAAIAEHKFMAQRLASEIEQAERGEPLEHQLRKLFDDLSDRLIQKRITPPGAVDYLMNWVENRNLSPRSKARYAGPIKLFIEHLGARAAEPLDKITPPDIDSFCQARIKSGLSAVTVRTDRKTLNGPFAQALRQGIIQRNPVAGAEPLEAHSEARQPFTRQQVEQLLGAAPDTNWKALIGLGAFAGMRLGDASKLKWADVDFFAGTINFRPEKTARRKRDLIVPIGPRLREILTEAGGPRESGFVCGELAEARIAGSGGLSLLFTELMKRAGVVGKTISKEGAGRAFNTLSFHSLRHFFVSELERLGVAPDIRQKLAGHTSADVHARYTHSTIETLAGAVAGL